MKLSKKLTRKLVFLVLAAIAAASAPAASRAVAPAQQGAARAVERVTDGDTLVLEGGEKVRLIGVDTPEIHDNQGRNASHARRHGKSEAVVDAFAEKARDFLAAETAGRRVLVEYGPEKADKYGRSLAFVYRDDGLFLNAEIIKRGYGFAYTRFPFKHSDDFKRYEAEARKNREGLWK